MLEYGIIWKVAVVTCSLIVGVGSYYYFGMKEDNYIEEVAEKTIEKETGYNIDLSPLSPED